MTTLIEVVWSAVALAGVVIAAIGYWLSRGDLAILRAAGIDSSRRVVARMGRRGALARFIMQGLNLYVGIYAVLTPDPIQSRSALDWSLVAALIGASALFGWSQWTDLRDRRRLERNEPAEDMAKGRDPLPPSAH